MEKQYIGDGVYAEIESGMVKLTTDRSGQEHVIYLETDVLTELNRYAEKARKEGSFE